MKYARLFRENEEPILVSAEDVKNGTYSRREEFVDPEYEFKVRFVSGARNNGGPYFRLYYSYEEYKRKFPDRATRYEIVANMRRYQESKWHKQWKKKMEDCCAIEFCVKNSVTKKWKFADAYLAKTKTCIEFQHSYIAFDFEERNSFYEDLGIKVVWLYDLPNANVCGEGLIHMEILEDNARGFFRISEKAGNLEDHLVYIQVKSGRIYRVKRLYRRESSTDKKSTIRYFELSEVYTEEEFINAIKSNQIGGCDVIAEGRPPKTLHELWDDSYKVMIVRNVENDDIIRINHNGRGNMYRDYGSSCIKYSYVDNKYNTSNSREYSLSRKDENRPIWELIKAFL